MKKIFFSTAIIILLVAVLGSCTKDYSSRENSSQEQKKNVYAITKEAALSELYDFLNTFPNTKSSPEGALSSKKVAKVDVVRTSIPTKMHLTKAFISTKKTPGEMMLPDTLFYVVTFEDDGFAVLAADSRMESTILAVTENGTLSPEDFISSEELYSSYGTWTYYRYDDMDDDDDDDDDDFDDWDIDDGDNNDYMPSDDDPESIEYNDKHPRPTTTPEQFIGSLLYDYAIDQVTPRDIDVPVYGSPTEEAIGNPADTNAIGGWTGATYKYKPTEEISPLIKTRWHQRSPFNNEAPLFDTIRGAAGCGAIAVAQILAYHQYPKQFYLNKIYMDWNKISKEYMQDSDIAKYDENNTDPLVAKFVREVGNTIKMNYGKEASGTTVRRCKRAFATANYKNVRKRNHYHCSAIIQMLRDGNPVCIGAQASSSVLKKVLGKTSGHIWVIDGFKIAEKYDRELGRYCGDITLLHCNWGWGGKCDGFYESHVFNLRSGALISDEEIVDTSDVNYSWAFRIIKYDNPNRK